MLLCNAENKTKKKRKMNEMFITQMIHSPYSHLHQVQNQFETITSGSNIIYLQEKAAESHEKALTWPWATSTHTSSSSSQPTTRRSPWATSTHPTFPSSPKSTGRWTRRVDYYAVLSLVKTVGEPEISNNHSFCPGRAWMAEKPWMEIVFVSLTINLV